MIFLFVYQIFIEINKKLLIVLPFYLGINLFFRYEIELMVATHFIRRII